MLQPPANYLKGRVWIQWLGLRQRELLWLEALYCRPIHPSFHIHDRRPVLPRNVSSTPVSLDEYSYAQ